MAGLFSARRDSPALAQCRWRTSLPENHLGRQAIKSRNCAPNTFRRRPLAHFKNGWRWKDPVPQARLVTGRWLVCATGELASQYSHCRSRHVRHRRRDLEVQRRAREVGTQARAVGVAS